MGGLVSSMRGKKSKKESQDHLRRAPSGSEQKARRFSVTGGDMHIYPEQGERGNTIERGSNRHVRFSALSSAGYEPDGVRKTNQDSFIAISDLGTQDISLFGVFDGHGACGHLVSGFVVKQIPEHLDSRHLQEEAASPSADAASVVEMLTKAFEETNNELERDCAIDSSLSGTTAVSGLVLGADPARRRIVMANAGDSRAVLAKVGEDGQCLAIDLSDDQKPDREDERARVQSFGGRVEPIIDETGEPIGPARVWLTNMMLPGLAMSRSIGDDIAASVGVHATPEVTAVPLLPKHKFMIVASDGVWEFLTSEDAVAIVVQCNGNAEKAAAELCARSFREWRVEEEVVDDITAVVVYF